MFRIFGIRMASKAFSRALWEGRVATVLLIFASAPANFQAVAATSTPGVDVRQFSRLAQYRHRRSFWCHFGYPRGAGGGQMAPPMAATA